mmetsp:Transcript_60179/g.160003  ORF Transcript_60179/g.160003 Transcript_60179/m.160003 type:complete len:215 (+) Transcript_60179:121-765(+)
MRNGSKAGLGFALCCGNIVRRSAVCPRGLTPLPGRTRPPGLRPGCPLGTCRPIRSGNAMLNHACRSTDSIRHIASSAYALRRDVKIPVISPESVLIFRHVCLLVLAGWINPKSETQASHDDWTSGLCGPLRGAVITLVGDHRGAGRLFRTLMRMLGARKVGHTIKPVTFRANSARRCWEHANAWSPGFLSVRQCLSISGAQSGPLVQSGQMLSR